MTKCAECGKEYNESEMHKAKVTRLKQDYLSREIELDLEPKEYLFCKKNAIIN